MDGGGYVALDGIYACICADRCCKVKGGEGLLRTGETWKRGDVSGHICFGPDFVSKQCG